MGLLRAGIRTHRTLVGSLPCKSKQKSSYWNTADSQTWLPNHTGEAVTDSHTVFEGMLSLSKGTVHMPEPDHCNMSCLMNEGSKRAGYDRAHPNVHLESTVTSSKGLWGQTTQATRPDFPTAFSPNTQKMHKRSCKKQGMFLLCLTPYMKPPYLIWIKMGYDHPFYMDFHLPEHKCR